MAKMTGRKAKVLDQDPRDDLSDAAKASSLPKDKMQDLVAWVTSKTSQWENYRRANLEPYWDMYERLWRGLWSSEEQNRKSERSKIISPALSEAVESSVSEIEEALFGRGNFFEVDPEHDDPELLKRATEKNKMSFKEDLHRMKFVESVSECLVNAGVYGNGIGEINLQEEIAREIRPKLLSDGSMRPEVVEKEVTYPCLRSVNPRNFLIDPRARNIEEALGCAIEDEVGAHEIREGQETGQYRRVPFTTGMIDQYKSQDPQRKTQYESDGVPVIRYYGLVPSHLLNPKEKPEALYPEDDKTSTEPGMTTMVEAIVVIANGETCLKAVENPYMMKDRPLVSFQWDVLPGNFYGRGICEKGAAPQRLLDAELRARIDALAFSGAPMMALDATKLPRGFKFGVYPGRSLMLNGDPNTILKPMKFGEVDQNTWQQAQMLDQFVQRATGAVDTISMAQKGAAGEARSGALSMSLSGVVKRHKRTLMRFIDQFLTPALTKLLWRSMQYTPERYIPLNTTFRVTSTTGIMQREYENMQLTQLLGSMQPGSLEYLMVLSGIVANSGVQNRQALLDQLKKQAEALQQAQVPMGEEAPVDPMAAQLQMLDAQLEMAKKEAEIAKMQAQTRLYNAQAVTEQMEPQLKVRDMMLKGIYAAGDQQDKEFNRRMKIADKVLKEQDMHSNERIARMQTQGSVMSSQVKAQAQLQGMLSRPSGVSV